MTGNEKKIILASASPRRKDLLNNLQLEFSIIPSDVDESIEKTIPPEEAVKLLALRKAKDIENKIRTPAVLIGCDTTVVIDNKSLGKPHNSEEAFKMLQNLSNRAHQVVSGIAIIDTYENKTITESVTSKVFFKKLTDSEIRTYIETGEPFDKAGAYAIQGFASLFVEKIEGCYNNIVGLPVFRLAQLLNNCNIEILK